MIQSLLPAFRRTPRGVRLEVIALVCSQPRFALIIGERHRRPDFVPCLVVDSALERDSFMFNDLDVLAIERVVPSVRPSKDESKHAAAAKVHLASRYRKPPRTEPPPEMLALGPRLEHELRRRVEHPRCKQVRRHARARFLRFQNLVQTLEALGHSILHSRLDRRIASLYGRIQNCQCNPRLAAFFSKHQRIDRLRPVAAPCLCGHDALGRHNLTIFAAHLHLVAVRMPPDAPPSSPRAQITLANRHDPAARTQHPPRQTLRLGPRLEHKRPRRIENPGYHNRWLSRLRNKRSV